MPCPWTGPHKTGGSCAASVKNLQGNPSAGRVNRLRDFTVLGDLMDFMRSRGAPDGLLDSGKCLR